MVLREGGSLRLAVPAVNLPPPRGWRGQEGAHGWPTELHGKDSG